MATTCKKHGKPRDVIVGRKTAKGAVLEIVGCVDCAADEKKKQETAPAPKKKPGPANSTVKQPSNELERIAKKEKTLGERFGFRF